jgi:hypothetical protein
MVKRLTDWLEKISAGSMAGSMLIGLYQGSNYAIILGFALIFVALTFEWRTKK